MNIYSIYFSPTGTTRKIVTAIAAGFAATQVIDCDLTRSDALPKQFQDGVVIIGIPVYAGRVPEVCLARLAGLSAPGVPAVLIVLYGNREYEDALVELQDVATIAGLNVIAAGAFIGEHSYATAEQPIAAGRPDLLDLEIATGFGREVVKKLSAAGSLTFPAIPGNRPYKERVPLGGITPVTATESCTLCGTCAQVCPTFVIDVGSTVETRADDCVMCCACVKNCPTEARTMLHPVIQERRGLLLKNCRLRKEPTLFL